MSCFPCFSSKKSKSKEQQLPVAPAKDTSASPTPVNNKQKPSAGSKIKKDEDNTIEKGNIAAQTFTFRELATATRNFRQECLLGEGGFGRVYKATLQPSGQVVAVKQLDRNGMQGNKEFLVEVLMLSLLHHPNLVNLIGYCADGDQKLLVYEYMPSGSLEDHLLDISEDKKPLDWVTRMKIASGAAQGLEYLHEKADPPVIYRNLKSSNILLDEEFNPRLTDFGLAKLGHSGNKMNVAPRVMGTYGYCAPEYERMGELTLKSDVYSFGVVLLELITGRRAIDTARPIDEQNLVTWAQPIFRDPKRFPEMADPLLKRKFPVKSLNQAVGVAAMCLQEEASVRPLISDVVAALSFLELVPPDDHHAVPSTLPIPTPESEISNEHEEDHHINEDGVISNHQNGYTRPDHDQNGDGESSHDGEHIDHEDRGNLSDYEEDGGSSESLYDLDVDTEDVENHQGDTTKRGSNILIGESKVESRDGSVGLSSRSSSNVGSSEDGSFSKNSRRNSNASVQQLSISNSNLSRNENDVESEDESVGSHSCSSSSPKQTAM